jgi:hypothetical protein
MDTNGNGDEFPTEPFTCVVRGTSAVSVRANVEAAFSGYDSCPLIKPYVQDVQESEFSTFTVKIMYKPAYIDSEELLPVLRDNGISVLFPTR